MAIPLLGIADPKEALAMLTSTYRWPDTPPEARDAEGTYQWRRWEACEVLANAVAEASSTGDPNARGDTNWIALTDWLGMHEFEAGDTIEALAAAWDAGIMW